MFSGSCLCHREHLSAVFLTSGFSTHFFFGKENFFLVAQQPNSGLRRLIIAEVAR